MKFHSLKMFKPGKILTDNLTIMGLKSKKECYF